MKIVPVDPRAGYLAHKEEIDDAIDQVLTRGNFILGQEVGAFEEEFASYIGRDSAIGVASGTDALELALRLCSIGVGDVVAVPAHTAVATIAAVELVGAIPLLIDIDPGSFTIDVSALEAALGERTSARISAVICVHLYGHPADMPSIMELARSHGVTVIEDCAQSHGARIADRMTGAWGDVAAFSFYPTKNLGCFGDGGAILLDDDLIDRARLLRQYGWKERFISELPGMNSRLDELQAAILRVKLKYLESANAARRSLASRYGDLLSQSAVKLPITASDAEHVFHQYVIRSMRRDVLKEYLDGHGVVTAIHYPLPIHLQPAYRERVPIGPTGVSNAEQICKEILSLPMYPELSLKDVDQVGRLVQTAESSEA